MKNGLLRWNKPTVKRDEEIEKVLRNDPFLYHKKKYVLSSNFNEKDDEDNINQELLVFQDENKKQINTLKNKIFRKSSTIDEHANNYINYMMKEKNILNKNIPTEPSNKNKKYIQLFKPSNTSLSSNEYAINNLLLSNYQKDAIIRKNNMNENNAYNSNRYINNMNKAFSYDENLFLPRIKKLSSDITDKSYYDKISKQLKVQLNKNYMDYNQTLLNKRYSPSNGKKMPLIKTNNDLALPPGRISNPNYYNLGESRLSSNPIVNPGNRALVFNHFSNHKLKSEFCY